MSHLKIGRGPFSDEEYVKEKTIERLENVLNLDKGIGNDKEKEEIFFTV